MIAVRLEGRLGNQLFQYAFIYAAAKKLKISFYLDKSVENFLLPQYFEVKNDFLAPLDKNIFAIDGYKNIFRVHAKKAFYNFINSLIFRGQEIIIDNETPAAYANNRLKNRCLYKGFFHSESYFRDFKEQIRRLYKIKKEHVEAFELIKNKLSTSKRKAVIHIRRSDYVDLNLSLPISYFKKAIEIINDNDVEYIFISDDPSYVATEFDYLPDKYVSNNNEIIDLQFMINADICILSNSSFSWWGAWLNCNKNKQVIAPKYWLGFNEGKEFPFGITDHIDVTLISV